MSEATIWGATVARSKGPIPFLMYEQRRRLLPELLLSDATRWAERTHLVQGRRRMTYAELSAAAARVAGQLAERGVRRGTRLLLLAGNSPDWVIAMWAGILLGAVVAPGNRWWSGEEVGHAITLIEPAAIIADAMLAPLLPEDCAAIRTDEVQAWSAGPALPIPRWTGTEHDPALIIFSAGTTGLPKAAVLAHRSVIANLHNLLLVSDRLPHQLADDRRPEVILASGPLFHIGGVQSLLLALLGGNTVVFLDGRFDPEQVLDLLEREQITVWGAVPTMVTRVLSHPSLPTRDLSTVRSISLGGAPVTPELTARLRAAFPAVRRGVSTVYGLTEAGGTVAAASGALMAEHPATSGPPMPVAEVRIDRADAHGVGEIVVRTPAQMLGYWADAEPSPIDSDGWLHTGDLGRIGDGLLYVTGRAKDVIIRGGENIAAAYVEEVLGRHPATAAVAVLGLPDRDLGEIVAAVVQLRSPATEAELTAYASEHLGRFQVPSRWWLRTEPLPMTDAGKVHKRALRARWLADLPE